MLRRTGQVTRLKLARHHYGSKYEQLLHVAAIGRFSLVVDIYLCIYYRYGTLGTHSQERISNI